jgi:hypothetical protein
VPFRRANGKNETGETGMTEKTGRKTGWSCKVVLAGGFRIELTVKSVKLSLNVFTLS